MIDITKMITDKLDEMHESGKLANIIETNLESTITNIVSQSLSYGNTRDILKKKIQDEIGIALDNVDFTTYTKILHEQVVDVLDSIQPTQEAKDEIIKAVDNCLAPAPKEVDFEDLVNDLLLAEHAANDDYHEDMDETPMQFFDHTLYVGRSRYGVKYINVGIDLENKLDLQLESYPEYRCPIHFSVSDKGEILHLTIDHHPVRSGIPWKTYNGSKRDLINMYYGKTKIRGLEDYLE